MEKKKTYQKATMKVVEVEVQQHLLAGSGEDFVGARMNHVWEEQNI